MRNTNYGKVPANKNCRKSDAKRVIRAEHKSNSVSTPSSSSWSEISKQVLRENIGAWKTLAKE